jgi:ribosome-associated protein
MNTPREIAMRAARALDGRKGLGIKLLEVTDVTSIADYFLICTGTSNTHVKTLCDSVEAVVQDELGEELSHREGHRGGTWVLLDFGCLVVHVFTNESREFYDLERLWNDAKEVPLDFEVTE